MSDPQIEERGGQDAVGAQNSSSSGGGDDTPEFLFILLRVLLSRVALSRINAVPEAEAEASASADAVRGFVRCFPAMGPEERFAAVASCAGMVGWGRCEGCGRAVAEDGEEVVKDGPPQAVTCGDCGVALYCSEAHRTIDADKHASQCSSLAVLSRVRPSHSDASGATGFGVGSSGANSAENLHASISRVAQLIARHQSSDRERTMLVSGAQSVSEAAAKAKRELDALEYEATQMEKHALEIEQVDEILGKRFDSFAQQRRGLTSILKRADLSGKSAKSGEQRGNKAEQGDDGGATTKTSGGKPHIRHRGGVSVITAPKDLKTLIEEEASNESSEVGRLIKAAAEENEREGVVKVSSSGQPQQQQQQRHVRSTVGKEDVFLSFRLVALANALRDQILAKEADIEALQGLLGNQDTKMKRMRADLVHQVTKLQERAFIKNTGIRDDDDNVRYLRRIQVAQHRQTAAEHREATMRRRFEASEARLKRVTDSWSSHRIHLFNVIDALARHNGDHPLTQAADNSYTRFNSTIESCAGHVISTSSSSSSFGGSLTGGFDSGSGSDKTKASLGAFVGGVLEEAKKQRKGREPGGARLRMAGCQTDRGMDWVEKQKVEVAVKGCQTGAVEEKGEKGDGFSIEIGRPGTPGGERRKSGGGKSPPPAITEQDMAKLREAAEKASATAASLKEALTVTERSLAAQRAEMIARESAFEKERQAFKQEVEDVKETCEGVEDDLVVARAKVTRAERQVEELRKQLEEARANSTVAGDRDRTPSGSSGHQIKSSSGMSSGAEDRRQRPGSGRRGTLTTVTPGDDAQLPPVLRPGSATSSRPGSQGTVDPRDAALGTPRHHAFAEALLPEPPQGHRGAMPSTKGSNPYSRMHRPSSAPMRSAATAAAGGGFNTNTNNMSQPLTSSSSPSLADNNGSPDDTSAPRENNINTQNITQGSQSSQGSHPHVETPRGETRPAVLHAMHRSLAVERSLRSRSALHNWALLLRGAIAAECQRQIVRSAREAARGMAPRDPDDDGPAPPDPVSRVMVLFDFVSGRRDAVRAVWEVRRAVLNRHRAENISIMSACAVHGPPLRPPPTAGEVAERVTREFEAISGTRDGDGEFDAYNVKHFPVPLHPLTRLYSPPGRGQIILSSEAMARLTEASMAIDGRYGRIDPAMRRDILRAALEHVMGVDPGAQTPLDKVRMTLAMHAPPPSQDTSRPDTSRPQVTLTRRGGDVIVSRKTVGNASRAQQQKQKAQQSSSGPGGSSVGVAGSFAGRGPGGTKYKAPASPGGASYSRVQEELRHYGMFKDGDGKGIINKEEKDDDKLSGKAETRAKRDGGKGGKGADGNHSSSTGKTTKSGAKEREVDGGDDIDDDDDDDDDDHGMDAGPGPNEPLSKRVSWAIAGLRDTSTSIKESLMFRPKSDSQRFIEGSGK